MTRGDCERAVAAAVRVDGIDLVPVGRSIGWLTQRGHLDLPENLSEPRERLAAIFEALSGDLTAQATKRSIPLRGDLIHVATSTLVEVDEYQHFTTFRRTTLDLYRPSAPRTSISTDTEISAIGGAARQTDIGKAKLRRGSAKPGDSGNAHTTTLYLTSRPRRWVTRSYGLTPPKATDRWHMSETANGCWQFLAELVREISSCSRYRNRLRAANRPDDRPDRSLGHQGQANRPSLLPTRDWTEGVIERDV